ncbi:probable phosphoribosylformylglycinamidine synthase, chloroplastic/mitochondrial [Quercus suber]|uniref:probable phosphoribosylformylglycinamidine synthase, chloroplastic/mitochondrial n=1 Tax=Quercus suber TaxID=58331 RepID=UPI0032E011DA
MAGAREITAAEFLQGTSRQNLFLHRNFQRNRSRLLWGTLNRQNPKLGISNRRGVSLRCCAQAKPRAIVSGGVSSTVDEQSSLVEKPAEEVIHFFRIPLLQEGATAELLKSVQTKVSNQIVGLKTEQCFNIGLDSRLSSEKLAVLKWLLQETYEPENLGKESFLEKKKQEGLNSVIVEVGPRLSFTTAWSSNAVSICRACGLTEVTRMEQLSLSQRPYERMHEVLSRADGLLLLFVPWAYTVNIEIKHLLTKRKAE